MTSKPRLALAAGTALAGIVLTGCGGSTTGQVNEPASGSAASGTSTAQASVTPGGPMAPGGAAPGGAGASSPGAAASGGQSATECAAAQLRIAYTDNSQIRNGALNGMSHADNVVMFTNEGSAPCQTRGYPGIAALSSAGTQVKQAARVSGNVPLIVLGPGQTASAMVSANTASCNTPLSVPGLLVTAPDQRTSTRLGSAGRFCLNSLTVGPLQPGNAAGLKL